MDEFPVYLDDHPFQIRERIIQEQRHGLRTADVVLLPHYMILRMKSERMFSEVESRVANSYPKAFVDSSHIWYAIGVTFMGMAYDRRRTKSGELPQNVSELASDKWKGALGIQSLTASRSGSLGAYYVSFLKRSLGNKKWFILLRALAEPGSVKTYDCIDHLLQGLIQGDHMLALTVYSLAYFREKTAGSPIALFEMEDVPKMPTFTSAALVRGSEDNGPAKRFLDFLLDEEAQKIMAKIPGISPVRSGIRTEYDFELDFDSKTRFHPDSVDVRMMKEAMLTFKRLKLP
jgi:ABC-type Fe3+ transport system substrate-binding protein